jgi:hypothetical protein
MFYFRCFGTGGPKYVEAVVTGIWTFYGIQS